MLTVALARGTVVDAAQSEPGEFPADLPGVVAVRAASGEGSALTPNEHGRDVVEVAARDLLSTSPGGRYDYFSGSSMAAARVAGLAALLRQDRAGAAPAELLGELDQRLAALGARSTGPDTRVVTHAPDAAPNALTSPPDGRPALIPARHREGT